MPRIFISYRRTDSAQIVGRIYDYLEREFGHASVFRDVDALNSGANFRAVILGWIEKADVMLVVIGDKWLDTREGDDPSNSNALRRLDNPEDYVRLEVETGLKQPNLKVIPLLVNKASFPSSDSLPDSIRELAARNAPTIRDDPDFRRDMGRLIDDLKQIDNTEDVIRERERLAAQKATRRLIVIVGVFALILTIIFAMLVSTRVIVLPGMELPTPDRVQDALMVNTKIAEGQIAQQATNTVGAILTDFITSTRLKEATGTQVAIATLTAQSFIDQNATAVANTVVAAQTAAIVQTQQSIDNSTATQAVVFSRSTQNAVASATAIQQVAIETQNAQMTADALTEVAINLTLSQEAIVLIATNDALSTLNAPTNTAQPTRTPTFTPSATSTVTPSPTATPTSTSTSTNTPTATPTPSFTPTATSTPTLTLTPNAGATQTAEAVQLATAQVNAAATQTSQATSIVTIDNSSVNLRSGPGQDYSIVTTATRGQTFVAEAYYNRNGIWYRIVRPNRSDAWVSASVVSITNSSALSLATSIPPTPISEPIEPSRTPTAVPSPDTGISGGTVPSILDVYINPGDTCYQHTVNVSWIDPDGNADRFEYVDINTGAVRGNPMQIEGSGGIISYGGQCPGGYRGCYINARIVDKAGNTSPIYYELIPCGG